MNVFFQNASIFEGTHNELEKLPLLGAKDNIDESLPKKSSEVCDENDKHKVCEELSEKESELPVRASLEVCLSI